MPYLLEFAPAAERQFKKLPKAIASRLKPKIMALGENPRPPGSLKMSGRDDRWRIRIGDYRVVYEIRDNVLLVLVLEIGHRREVYR